MRHLVLIGLGLVLLLAGCGLFQQPAIITAFEALPSPVSFGMPAIFSWTLTTNNSASLTCTINFGDGQQTQFMAARCSNGSATHAYANSGTFTAVITASTGSSTTSAIISVYVTAPTSPTNLCPAPSSSASAQSASQQSVPQGMGDFSRPHVPGELIIYRGTASLQSADFTGAVGSLGLSSAQSLGHGWVLYKTAGNAKTAAGALVGRGLARYAQPNYLYRPTGLSTPNDPLYTGGGAQNPEQQLFKPLHMPAAWSHLSTPLPCTPVVAVLDTAFNTGLPDLAGNLITPAHNAVDNNSNVAPGPAPPGCSTCSSTTEWNHGMSVAGLVDAVTDNGIGVAGVGYNLVKVLPIKVFQWEANGSGGYSVQATTVSITKGVDYAINHGAQVINMSLGGSGNDPALDSALSKATGLGVVSIAAAGNKGVTPVLYPASLASTIAVGSVQLNGTTRSGFSSYGKALEVMAPGGNVSPSELVPVLSLEDGRYLQSAGTSFSAPQVSGIVALYMAEYYGAYGTLPSYSRVETCLEQTASNDGTRTNEMGYGTVQADQVLSNATYCFP